MNNEGFLSRHTFGGEHVYTQDHPPVILSGLLKAGHGEISVGSVLVQDADGIDIIGASNTLPIVGVSDEGIAADADQKYVSYVAHGTVKAEMLKGTDGADFTETAKLQEKGIYAI